MTAEVMFGVAPEFPVHVPVVIVGGGACGMSAALAARDAGVQVLVIERDASPSGSTALSSGFVPACDTRWQTQAGVSDDVATMTADVLNKCRQQTDATYAERVCAASGPTLEWLADEHGLEFVLVDGFTYPGHSALRMHAHPERTGRALISALMQAAVNAEVDVLENATARVLFVDDDQRIQGLEVERSDGSRERVGCDALVLACNGYGGSPELVRRYIPEMTEALYFGHPGNQGDAITWGQQLGAKLADLSAYQGHGSVASPHGALITWAIMMEGGIQVNSAGERFSNEHHGYSEQAVAVLAQPGGVVWNLYDARLHELAQAFEDYRGAIDVGATRMANTMSELADIVNIPEATLAATLESCAAYQRGDVNDPFGRDFTTNSLLEPPYYAVRVTGALFHTQGGLCVDERAAVIRENGTAFANLFAGGGAARGVSGSDVSGYLSGNGLLTATVLGRIAGTSAAETIRSSL